ncbi:MAG: hypothetical protein ACYTG2_15680 [Planctomycetota bacterium]
MNLGRSETPRETPQATLEQRFGGHKVRLELYVDRIAVATSDLLGSREFSLPLDMLSPHVVIRQRGPRAVLAAGILTGVVLLLVPGGSAALAGLAFAVGGVAWWAGRAQYIVFPGQIADVQLYRDRPDAATARRFVSQVVHRIEEFRRELRVLERTRDGEQHVDRVTELLAFRDLFAEGIIDRAELRLATEILARRKQRRIGFR